MALYNTPEQYGGCRGCRFFVMCKGHCPGTGLDMDWRNKPDSCLTWKVSFGIYEKLMLKKGQVPLSLNPDLKKYEDILMEGYSKGIELRLKQIKRAVEENWDYKKFIDARIRQINSGIPNPHADHTDETGQYKKDFYEKYGIEL